MCLKTRKIESTLATFWRWIFIHYSGWWDFICNLVLVLYMYLSSLIHSIVIYRTISACNNMRIIFIFKRLEQHRICQNNLILDSWNSTKLEYSVFNSLSLAAVNYNLIFNRHQIYSEHHLGSVLTLQSLWQEQSNSPCTLRQEERSLIAAQSHPQKPLLNLTEKRQKKKHHRTSAETCRRVWMQHLQVVAPINPSWDYNAAQIRLMIEAAVGPIHSSCPGVPLLISTQSLG